jgi:hypothetical protein
MSKRNNKHRYREASNAVISYEGKPQERKNSPIKYILEQQKLRTRQDLLKLRLAIDCAENVINPNRQLLHDIYRDVEKDPSFHSNWTSRKMKVTEKPFKVRKPGGDENEQLTEILEAPWFFQWIDAAMDARKWDFSLIEFGPLDIKSGCFQPYKVGNKFYDPITVIDRDNVKPELGIITSIPGDVTGVSFDDKKFSDYLMFVGDFHLGTGLLWKATKYILFKDNALGNWSEWAEVFGMDKRVGYTDVDGPPRDAFIKALRDMGSNAYGVFSTRDKVEYLGTQRTDAYKVYSEMLKYIDEQLSKLVFGQDVVSNNTGKVVGSVGENIANMYGDNDARFIKSLVNTRLFPLMENLGFNWQGHVFDWDTTEKLSLIDRSKVDALISSDMGMQHSADYINNTYGTDVEVKPEPDMNNPADVNKKVKNTYDGA